MEEALPAVTADPQGCMCKNIANAVFSGRAGAYFLTGMGWSGVCQPFEQVSK